MTPIRLIDENDQLVEAELEGGLYYLGFAWNEEGGFWTLSVRDLNQEILVSGVRVVNLYPLLDQVRQRGFPPGEIFVFAPAEEILDRNCFTGGRAAIYYVDLAEMEGK